MLYVSLDSTHYTRSRRTRLLTSSLRDGLYVYARSPTGEIYVLPDGPHQHPRILGTASPVLYAGDMTIENGMIVDVTNLSGTFQCQDREALIAVVDAMKESGCLVAPGAVRFFPADGSRPEILA